MFKMRLCFDPLPNPGCLFFGVAGIVADAAGGVGGAAGGEAAAPEEARQAD